MEKRIAIVVIILACVSLYCSKIGYKQPQEEVATSKPIFDKNCFTVCDINKSPDLQLVTNASDTRIAYQVDGYIDSSTYFWRRYNVRTHPVRLVQNYLTKGRDAIRYGWDSLVLINRVQLQCLIDNVAPYDSACKNDWDYKTSQGYQLPGQATFYDGLFQFDTYEKGNGNSWKFLYSDFKKEFYPSSIPNQGYLYADFCYSAERTVQAQCGDFYYNYFRLPNHDGIYKIVLKFNPLIKGCRAVKETNYDNNEETVFLKIENNQIFIL